jgi:histidinol-phosphate phosphatase family protein
VVTNQSGVGAGRITEQDVQAVNDRVEELLGPFEVWQVCPHQPDDGCDCRKPAPGMVKTACADLGVDPSRCVVVGDIGGDVEAAQAAGASGILVPTPTTRPDEVAAAEQVSRSLRAAVDAILRGDW